ncbi:hypothetical protein AAF712_009472 [Marasmius tenuissimus]|uniref:Uncharacterized protein n=1 Tax=Marasmius tenuissimus TaxID=585030 RepID=A0ABR2ZPM1_9AGAR
MEPLDLYQQSTQQNVSFTSVNRKQRIPTMVPHPQSLYYTEDKETSHFQEFNWIHPAHPFMALVPQVNIFRGDLFGVLDYKMGWFPIFRNDRQRWQMAMIPMQKWDMLEVDLMSVVRRLIEAADPGNIELSDDFLFWTYPATYGYSSSCKTAELLEKALDKA